ncbi:hypothetical protein PHYSODRAFT_327875 [Phytophthora sojae]|uniref:BZIP domain-containing protein n=1 Tax=Phytophthora sojae (strain P6497) TaxID=1094619 RepID=G4Z823_PHYSP|nr:hypothetical protein PHYSODRAFT_327875 [Phytophthora sojae]EGZ19678.1 hypothetical protein PHYSODRAFT_327875 [Phytophthora sojae]|eukprot:XP_009522395.1 hypothetical protein PHYSODRAFT_327875 [Phytophthora sojae]
MHLPVNWTQTDQEIIETLLFDQPLGSYKSDESNAQQLMRYRSLIARQIANDTRKSKHRAVQRRFMQRKKDQVSRVKEEVQRLQQERDLLQISREKQQLQAEHDALKANLNNCAPLPYPSQAQIELLLAGHQKLIREHYIPLTAEDWNELLRKNLQEFQATSCETDYESTGAVVMGWSDRRKIDLEQGSTRFVMSKRFDHLNAEAFYTTTFDKLCQPETHPRLFHPVVTIQMQQLQRVDDDGVVLHRCMFNPQTGAVVHTVESMMRVQHGRNHVIFLRTLEHNAAYGCLPKSHHWLQLFTALVFTPSPSSRFAASGDDVKYWLMEMLYVILRFESVMVAPVFALRSA